MQGAQSRFFVTINPFLSLCHWFVSVNFVGPKIEIVFILYAAATCIGPLSFVTNRLSPAIFSISSEILVLPARF